MSLFLFAWAVFLSAELALRKDKLANMDLLIEYVSPKAAWIIKLVNYIIMSAFLLQMLGYGIRLSITTSRRVFQGIPGFSYTWVSISIPFASLLMLITIARKMFIHIKHRNSIMPAVPSHDIGEGPW